jgi:uncharacterized Zn-binding protein involved in type VI secretion
MPAARITDMHVCPMFNGPVPHVGGPISLGEFTVLTGMLPQARLGDMAICVGPPDIIAKGSAGVLVGKKPAARMLDNCAHGGMIVLGLPTVLIGEVGGGGGGGAGAASVGTGQSGSYSQSGAKLLAFEEKSGQADLAPTTGEPMLAFVDPKQQAQVLTLASQSGAAFCETCFAKASPPLPMKAPASSTPAPAQAKGGGTTGMDKDKAAKHLSANAAPKSQGKCAKYVRQAMEAGGMDTTGRPVSAKDYGPFLDKKGFAKVSPENYVPQKGDVVVIQPYKGGSVHGHIAMYDGQQWVSDFKQKDMWGGSGYRNNQPPHQIYRP